MLDFIKGETLRLRKQIKSNLCLDKIKLFSTLNTNQQFVIVKTDSFLARIACRWMKNNAVAMVMGKTIHVYGARPMDLLSNMDWLLHEIVHIRQFEENGYIRFIGLYLLEWMKHGYHNNRYEIEARDRTRQMDSLGVFDRYEFKIK